MHGVILEKENDGYWLAFLGGHACVYVQYGPATKYKGFVFHTERAHAFRMRSKREANET